MGDGLDRMVKAVAALAAVTQDLVVLHSGEGMPDSGANPTMLCVVFLLTREEWATGPFSVRDDESGVDVGAVAQHRDAVAALGETGDPPDLGVSSAAWGWPGGGHGQPGVGIDDDLHMCREPVVAARSTDLPVADRNQGAVHDPQPVRGLGGPGSRLEGEEVTQPLDDPAHPGPLPPRSRTTRNKPSNCRIRRPVNVSTHNGSGLNTPRIQGKCPDHGLVQHALRGVPQLAVSRLSKVQPMPLRASEY